MKNYKTFKSRHFRIRLLFLAISDQEMVLKLIKGYVVGNDTSNGEGRVFLAGDQS